MTRDLTQQATADARLQVFNCKRGWQAAVLVPAFFLVTIVIWLDRSWDIVLSNEQNAVAIDFTVYWAAAKLAFAGDPVSAFDPANLAAVHGVHGDVWMPWLYPPSFMMLILPLGAMSFHAAWMTFLGLSVLAMLFAIRPFSGGVKPVWIGFALAPAIFPTLTIGQNSLLWVACLLAALAALRAEKPIMAGVLIGLLTLKPQLGILIPIALLACGAWRTIAAATLTTILLILIPTFIMGVDYWSAMKALAEHHADLIRSAVTKHHLMISPYSVLAGLGTPEPIALAAQWCLTAMAAVVVALAWRSPYVSFDLRAATLLLAITISVPYFWHYESTLLAPAALFLIRAGVLTSHRYGYVLAALMWLGVGPMTAVLLLTDIDFFSVRFIYAPIAIAACATCTIAVFRRLRSYETFELKNEVT